MAHRKKRYRVVMAAAHLLTREALRALFAESDVAELVADSGEAHHVVSLCKELLPDVVVIFTADMTPGPAELALRVKCLPDPPAVVAVAAGGQATLMREMFEAGASAFILHDCGFKRVEDAVVAAAEGDVLIDVYASRHSDEMNAGVRPYPDALSARELQTLKLMSTGLSTKQIARTLHLSPKTVETYRAHIYSKLNIDSLVGLTKYAIAHGLATSE